MIKRIKRGYTKAHLIYYDIETKTNENGELVFRLGAVTAENQTFIAYDKETFTEILISLCEKNKSNYLIAHNAQFDFSLLNHDRFSVCELYGFSTQPFLIHYKFKDDNKHVTNFVFIDSMSFFKNSLDELGKMFNEEKQIVDSIRDKFDSEIAEYCKQDTIVLSKIMNFIDEQCIKFDIRFPVTFAQMSFMIFKRHFLKQTLFNSDNEDIMRLERGSYFGGRVEAFNFNVQDTAYVNDINSLYPFVMENEYFPIKIQKYYSVIVCKNNQEKALSLLKRCINKKKLVIAKVVLDLPNEYIGKVPKRYDDKLIFPCGKFETTLCNPELELIKDNIVYVKEFTTYYKKRIFANFVTTMYHARMKYDKKHPLNLFFKLVMNSLYGKFAQRKFIFERKEEYDFLIRYGRNGLRTLNNFQELDYFDYKAYYRSIDELNKKSFVAISSFVTSYSRKYLYNYLVENQNNLIYCDTDSLIVKDQANLDFGDKLGQWKLENTLHNFQVLGNKHYIADGLRKTKGVPSTARVLDNYNFEFEKITKIRESIVRFGTPQPHLILMKKVYKDEYTKRIVNKDLTTSILVINESYPESFLQV